MENSDENSQNVICHFGGVKGSGKMLITTTNSDIYVLFTLFGKKNVK